MERDFCVYITTNPGKTVLYIGVTNDLPQRIVEHYLNRGKTETFAGRYYCYLLVHWEQFFDVEEAIAREKELKGWSRKKKLTLIQQDNAYLNSLNGSLIHPWPPKDGSIRD